MPITESAKKALRQNIRRRARNLKRQKAVRDVIKTYRKLVGQRKLDEAKALLPKVYQLLDKTAKVGTLKRNTAARLKSRLTHLISVK
jgi:small subunit ribosomal protein S20